VWQVVVKNAVSHFLPDRELLTAKLKLESDLVAQRSVASENRSRVEMLENVLAKEAVGIVTSLTCDEKFLQQSLANARNVLLFLFLLLPRDCLYGPT
jgi:hypothetical protein